MDKRAARAQALLWEVQALRSAGDHEAAARKSRVMAKLHGALAVELLDAGDGKGWIHLYAGVTAWAKAGGARDIERSAELLENGYARAYGMKREPTAVLAQLHDLLVWLVRRATAEPVFRTELRAEGAASSS